MENELEKLTRWTLRWHTNVHYSASHKSFKSENVILWMYGNFALIAFDVVVSR